MSRSLYFALVLVISGSVLLAGCSQTPDAQGPSFSSWASGALVPVEGADLAEARIDSRALSESIGSARLVGLGESRHDTREQFQLKGALVRQLIEEQGFRVLVLEESLPHARMLDDWVRGGEGDLEAVMQDLAGWYLWDVEEMHALLRWMRGFNEGRSSGDQLRVFGVDITAPALGVREVLSALERAGADAGLDEETLGLELQEGNHWPRTWERYRTLTVERRAELGANYDRLVEAARALGDERVLLLAEHGQRGNTLFLTTTLAEGGEVRERGMAAAALWILENEIPNERAIFWAHNLHVVKASFEMPALAEGVLTPSGVYLHEALGDDYLAIGASFGQGQLLMDPEDPESGPLLELPDEDVLDGALARLDERAFLLDLREAQRTPGAAAWLNEPRGWVAQGSTAQLVPGEAIDLVFFIDEVSRATPSENARRRFAAMSQAR